MCKRLLVATLGVATAVVVSAGAGRAQEPPSVSAESVRVTQYQDAVVVYLKDLDMLRQRTTALMGEFRLIVAEGGEEATRQVDLGAGCQHPAIILDRREGARYQAVSVVLKDGDRVLLSERLVLGPVVTPQCLIPMSGEYAAIEPGSAMGEAPVIPLPDLSRLTEETIGTAVREIGIETITRQVRCDVNYPLVSANNNAAISRQSAHPEDDGRRSIYVPMKSQLFDQETGKPTKVAHYLVEVPFQAEWLEGEEDLVVNLESHRWTLTPTSPGCCPGLRRYRSL